MISAYPNIPHPEFFFTSRISHKYFMTLVVDIKRAWLLLVALCPSATSLLLSLCPTLFEYRLFHPSSHIPIPTFFPPLSRSHPLSSPSAGPTTHSAILGTPIHPPCSCQFHHRCHGILHTDYNQSFSGNEQDQSFLPLYDILKFGGRWEGSGTIS